LSFVLTSSQKLHFVSDLPKTDTVANGPEPSVRIFALTCAENTKSLARRNRQTPVFTALTALLVSLLPERHIFVHHLLSNVAARAKIPTIHARASLLTHAFARGNRRILVMLPACRY
jgi:hypothetical protein